MQPGHILRPATIVRHSRGNSKAKKMRLPVCDMSSAIESGNSNNRCNVRVDIHTELDRRRREISQADVGGAGNLLQMARGRRRRRKIASSCKRRYTDSRRGAVQQYSVLLITRVWNEELH